MNNNLVPAHGDNIGKSSTPGNLSGIREAALQGTEYVARVTRKNPAAIVIMIDQSGSMRFSYTTGVSKAKTVADIVNSLLQDLLNKCIKEQGIKNYFNILVFGYGDKITKIWEGGLEDRQWVTVEDLRDNVVETVREEAQRSTPFGVKNYVKERYKWISEKFDGSATNMRQAFEYCQSILEDWTLEHEDSFPPLVFNITDGLPTDIKGDFDQWLQTCNNLTSVSTKDGNTLLFNILLTNGEEVVMPGNENSQGMLANEYHRAMIFGSSVLPVALRGIAYNVFKEDRIRNEHTRCLIINSTPKSVIGMLNIGTNTLLSNVSE